MDNIYQAIDFLFAAKIFPKAPESATLFLAHLLKSAREGHLCIDLTTLPSHLQHGEHLLPPSLFESILVRQDHRIYLRKNWECEQSLIKHLRRICSHLPSKSIDFQKFNLNTQQQAAIKKVAKQTLTLITGGPGSGKTYTAACLIRLCLESGIKSVAIAAPTGKAAANLRVALGPIAEKCVIKTLHALLKSGPLYADFVLVDEASMVDAQWMARLFGAMREKSRLVLLGDPDQLPPIESGHVFADLAHDPTLTTELKICLRTELQSIIDLAARVKRGEIIPTEPLPDTKHLVQQVMQKKAQVLTPLRKGIYGSEHLNALLFAEHQKQRGGAIPILITVNDSSLGLYNGDVGLLEGKQASFSGGREYSEHLLPPYEYAYALSVHKSQGSEYDKVVIVLPEGAEIFGREMLYTALTRAKKEITLLAHPGVMEKLVKTRTQRFSNIRLMQ
jgi:exodeoxyribonuclease V alpha subunit